MTFHARSPLAPLALALMLTCRILVVHPSASADSTGASTAGASKADISCMHPVGRMERACNHIKEALKDKCNKTLSEQVRKKVQENGSQLQKAAKEWCPEIVDIARDEGKWDYLLMNLFGGVVAKESGADPTQDAKGPNGIAKGYFQIDAKSTAHYQCCKEQGFDAGKEHDPAANAKCGVGLNLQNMNRGDCIADGGGGDDNSCGIAKFQEVCRDKMAKDKATKEEIKECTMSACQQIASGAIPKGTGGNEGGGGSTR